MSHFTTIKTRLTDIEAVRDACSEMGLTLEAHTNARGYAGNTIQGDYVIKLKGPYDIALNRQANGEFAVKADLWQGHVEREVGKGFGRLKQLYGVHKATREARRKGMLVRRSNQADGRIRLRLCRC